MSTRQTDQRKATSTAQQESSLRRWLKERPDFPRPRKIGARTTVWIVAELEQWRDAQAHQ